MPLDQEETFDLRLSCREMQALFRSLIEYEKALRFSALRDSTLVGAELSHLQAVSEKVSLAFHYPASLYPSEPN